MKQLISDKNLRELIVDLDLHKGPAHYIMFDTYHQNDLLEGIFDQLDIDEKQEVIEEALSGLTYRMLTNLNSAIPTYLQRVTEDQIDQALHTIKYGAENPNNEY